MSHRVRNLVVLAFAVALLLFYLLAETGGPDGALEPSGDLSGDLSGTAQQAHLVLSTELMKPPTVASSRRELKKEGTSEAPIKDLNAIVVRGRVLDTLGNGVPGISILILGESNPVAGEPRAMYSGAEGNLEGGSVTTDDQGAFLVELENASPVLLRLQRLTGYRLVGEPLDWLLPSANEVNIVVEPVSTGELQITVFDLSSMTHVEDFSVSFRSLSGGLSGALAKGTTLVQSLDLDSPSGMSVKVTLTDPKGSETVARDVWVHAGMNTLELTIQRGGKTGGWVADDQGKPIQGAVVWIGPQPVGELSKRFVGVGMKRSVRTDKDGWFELPSSGRLVSVWHADYSPTTVLRSEVGHIMLLPHGAVSGTVDVPSGTAVDGLTVLLDADRKVLTDLNGRFSFDAVEAGFHLLQVDGGLLFGVQVASREKVNLSLSTTAESVQLALRAGELSYDRELVGAVTGSLGAFPITPVSSKGGFVTAHLGPGNQEYILLGHGGEVATVQVWGQEGIADLGTASLTVNATVGSKVYIVPEGFGVPKRLAVVMARRVPASGMLQFSPLPQMSYVVGLVASGEEVVVKVDGLGTSVTIP